MKFTRRKFIVGGLVGGAVAFGYSAIPPKPKWNGEIADNEHLFNNWIKIAPDGTVTAFVAQAEMGQGVMSGFAAILAEELNADWDRMAVAHAPNHPSYSNLLFAGAAIPIKTMLPAFMAPAGEWLMKEVIDRMGLIATGGSSSVRDKFLRLREAGAFARMTLEQAAADVWQVPLAECFADNHKVLHKASGKSVDFSELVAVLPDTSVTQELALKSDADFKIIGKEGRPRLDLPKKVDGSAVFGADVRVPGMVYAAIKNGGSSLGDIVALDKETALAQPGVIDVVHENGWVAVVAKSYWHAQMAADMLTLERDRSAGSIMADDWQESRIEASSQDAMPGYVLHDDGDVETRFADAADTIQATYTVPYLAHACLETNTATASYVDGKVEVWAPTQSPAITQTALAGAMELSAADITVNTTFLGGGFGRKAEPDPVVQAALISRAVGKPVQLIWSREEDIHGDTFRPAAAATMTAALGSDGSVRAVKTHVSSQSVGASFNGRWFGGSGQYEGKDPSTVEGLEELPYEIGSYQLGYTDNATPANVGYWRSVGHSYTAYFAEAFADEVAARLGEDPLDYRLSRIKDDYAKATLEAVADLSGYRQGPPPGRYHGVSYHYSFGAHVAMVVEIEPQDGEDLPAVKRVFAAVDVGLPIDPDTIRAQIEGSVVFGLTAALYGDLKFDGGIPTSSNFDTYQLLSLAETPEVQVAVLKSGGPLGGVGEPGVPPVAPALANAIFKWTGQPVRKLPLINNMPNSLAGKEIASAEAL